MISCSVAEKFKELRDRDESPVCLFPTRKACEDLNNEMLDGLGSKVVKMDAIDEVDDTASNQHWSKKATQELERLNKDCNLMAGLQRTLRVAEGARVMLRRNICTKSGLVNGSLGTVAKVKSKQLMVKFDHLPEPVEINRVRSKFQVLKKFYVYRTQYPLILVYAVTIHKCQGLSLNCAIIDLSDNVFSSGMAYVAQSRVRTLDGVHLTNLDIKSFMVNVEYLKEINRLRSTFRNDLPQYDIPLDTTSKKRRLTGVSDMGVVKTKKPKLVDPLKKAHKIRAN